MHEVWHKHRVLLVGAALSLLVLLAFLVLEQTGAAMMDLPARWLLVSLIPLLVAAVVGGYVRTRKGFGVELEARLGRPVTTLELGAHDVAMDLPGGPREDRAYLDSLSDTAKRKITRLSIDVSTAATCVPGVIETYLTELKKLEYVEVKGGDGAFRCLIPARSFKKGRKPDLATIRRFAQALVDDDVLNEFRKEAITRTVSADTDLVATLRALREAQAALAAVVAGDGRFQGVVEAADVERKLADEVLATKA